MQIISAGSTYEIFDDTLKTYDKFPSQSYVVRFSKFKGFYLEKYVDMEIKEDKVYGVHNEKVEKVLRSFKNFNRNLGVILSGDKGIGKSLFAKMLANKAIENNIPLIVVDTYIPGIASYIESIDQEVMVLFDEFDKTFADVKAEDGQASPQTNLLTLFDGVSCGKKLFVITCNDISKLSGYIINRPGRFHYHFRFEYPNMQEVQEYLHDKLNEKYYGEIDSVVAFSRRINLNYDCLRAIAFELNNGLSFKDAISDLNIVNYNDYTRYNIALHYKNGLKFYTRDQAISLFDDNDVSFWMGTKDGYYTVKIEFNTSDAEFDMDKGAYIVTQDNIKVSYEEDEEVADVVKCAKESEIDYLVISRVTSKSIHYAV